MVDFVDTGLSANSVPYEEALELQRATHRSVADGDRPDTVILLQHPSVYTAGKRTEDFERPTDGTPVIDVDRGGKITWHGPGQLVGYPILRLAEPIDVVGYVRRLEGMLIDVLDEFGIAAGRVEGRSGVWVGAPGPLGTEKIAAIGIRVAEGVTMHGFALNVNNSLEPYHRIIACGIQDAGVTTMSAAARPRRDSRRGRPGRPAPVLEYAQFQRAGGGRMTTTHDGRKLLRLEVRNSETPIERKPEWIKTRANMGPEYLQLTKLVKEEELHTVCQEAGCPNIFECWEDREATFLIGGSQCTRRCDFCQIDTGKPADYDKDEPRRVAESVTRMNLRYATVTGVARDDLPDEGAWLHAETVRQIHAAEPRHRGRDPRDRLLRQPGPARRGVRVASGGLRPQRRDRAADLQAHPARRSPTSARSACSRKLAQRVSSRSRT